MQTTSTTTEYRDMTAPDGRHVLTIRIDRHPTHTAVIVVTPIETSLNRGFPTVAEVDAYLNFLGQQVQANTPLYQIEHNAGVLTSTSAALDHIDTALIEAVNEVIDAAVAETAAGQPTVSVEPTNWHRLRREIAAQHTARPVRPTRTSVHTQPPTPAQLDRMRQHRGGRVTCGDGQAWTLLRGILDRGHADPATVEYWPGTRKIRAVRLNQRGMSAIQNEEIAA